MRKEIDIPRLFLDKKSDEDILVSGGDVIYVHRAPMYYIYGETQRPGSFRIEREMTVRQALAQGGGPTQRGDQDRLRLHRRNAEGKIERLSPELDDPVLPDDVIYVRESFF
jgi:polysaccharide export outer membrane protein